MGDRDHLSVLIQGNKTDRLLRLSVAAKRLGGWSPRTLRDWIAQGKIDAVQLPNGRWMVRQSEVDRYLYKTNI